MTPPAVRHVVRLDAEERVRALAADVREGLSAEPKWLPPKWFYDGRGSELFEEITRLPEYYPTRAEREILAVRAREIARLTRAETLVEIGSGSSEKTRLLIDALREEGTLRRFVPLDVSEAALTAAAAQLRAEYPGLAVEPVLGDLAHHLDDLPPGHPRLVAFLGSSIGNLTPAERTDFLAQIAHLLGDGDAFLLGVDLVKPADRLEAAYDDAAGVTAAFNRNVLEVVNRELGADFRPERFEHVARWVPEHEWVEMRLRSGDAQAVTIAALGLTVRFAAGEELRTEISAKFRHRGVVDELATAGLRELAWWTDAAGDFGLVLAARARPKGQ